MAPPFTRRLHRTGGLILFGTGILDIVVGLASGVEAVTPPVYLSGVPAFVVVAGSGLIVVIGGLELAGGWAAYTGQYWYGSVTAGVLGLLVLVTAPLDVLALVVIALSEGQFSPDDVQAPNR